jgi:hypothetical protein
MYCFGWCAVLLRLLLVVHAAAVNFNLKRKLRVGCGEQIDACVPV